MRTLRFFLILSCMLAGVNLYARSANDDATAVAPPPSKPVTSGKPVEQRPQPPKKPAASFTPSERIGADNAVSFPVDI
jgi:hypothetical protein